MKKFINRLSKKKGLPPGTLVHVGEKKVEKARIRIIDYDSENFDEREVQSIEECFPYKDSSTVTWINIDGLHDVDLIEKIGQHFNVHSLVMEDIVNTGQRPKMEDFEEYLYVVIKILGYEETTHEIKVEQFSLILTEHCVISFQERVGDVFEMIRSRLRKSIGRIRKCGPDYLLYSLIDTTVDHYFTVLERIGEHLESVEEELLAHPTPGTLEMLHTFKRELIFLRKSVWPLREVISTMERHESTLIKESTDIYLRDVYDHAIRVAETTETLRDMLSGMFDTYLSSLSNRMNEVMKVLTIIATIFIPLTFIAGVYGMNFEYIPELKWHNGYFIVWGVMLIVGVIMVVYFKKKKWL